MMMTGVRREHRSAHRHGFSELGFELRIPNRVQDELNEANTISRRNRGIAGIRQRCSRTNWLSKSEVKPGFALIPAGDTLVIWAAGISLPRKLPSNGARVFVGFAGRNLDPRTLSRNLSSWGREREIASCVARGGFGSSASHDQNDQRDEASAHRCS